MGIVVSPPRKVIFTINHTNTIMAPNGKAFSSQIKKMSKKPLKYNPEEVMVINVDMAKHAVDKFNEEYGEHWMSVVGDNYGVDVGHNGNFAQFNMGSKNFVIYKAA